MAFKDTFLKLRKERGWTQQQVADQIGLSVGQVKKYEKGDSAPTLHILGRIAMVYGVSTDDDLVELDRDPRQTAPDELKDIKVVRTWVAGEVVGEN